MKKSWRREDGGVLISTDFMETEQNAVLSATGVAGFRTAYGSSDDLPFGPFPCDYHSLVNGQH